MVVYRGAACLPCRCFSFRKEAGLGHESLSLLFVLHYRYELQKPKCSRPRLGFFLRYATKNMPPPFSPAHKQSSLLTPSTKIKYPRQKVWDILFCVEGRARTADPSLFRRMLYQLSYLDIFIYLIVNYFNIL